MLKRAIQGVVDDSSYHQNVEPVATALQQARLIAEWSSQVENKAIFDKFKKRLEKELKGCVPHDITTSSATYIFWIC